MDENPYSPPQTESKSPLGKLPHSPDDVQFRKGTYVMIALGVLFFVLFAIRWL